MKVRMLQAKQWGDAQYWPNQEYDLPNYDADYLVSLGVAVHVELPPKPEVQILEPAHAATDVEVDEPQREVIRRHRHK